MSEFDAVFNEIQKTLKSLSKRINKFETWEPIQAIDIGARVTHSVGQTSGDLSNNILAFDTERWDTDTIHDTSTNNSRLTCQTAGKYLIIGNIYWSPSFAATDIRLSIKLNNTTYIARNQRRNIIAVESWIVTTIYDLAVDDYVELETYQNSGGPQTVAVAANYSPEFMMQKIG